MTMKRQNINILAAHCVRVLQKPWPSREWGPAVRLHPIARGARVDRRCRRKDHTTSPFAWCCPSEKHLRLHPILLHVRDEVRALEVAERARRKHQFRKKRKRNISRGRTGWPKSGWSGFRNQTL